jgi:hypothetical protein
MSAEAFVKGEVRGMGITMPRLPSEEKLISLATKYAPKRLAKVQDRLAENQGISLYALSPYDLLDMVYGVDLIVSYKGRYIGIDVTVNTDMHKLHHKEIKIQELSLLHSKLGLSKVAVYNPNLQSLRELLSSI